MTGSDAASSEWAVTGATLCQRFSLRIREGRSLTCRAATDARRACWCGLGAMDRRSPASKLLVAVLALGAALLLANALPGGSTEPAGAQTTSAAKPNIVVLLTDYQESRSMRVMKITAK